MIVSDIKRDVTEFGRSWVWYGGRKVAFFGAHFEGVKGVIIDVLKARRGTYQKPFLHVGMVFLMVLAALSTPVIANKYPTSASANEVVAATPPSAVLNDQVDITNLDTQTIESKKLRRDVVEHTVSSGETLSSIASAYDVDTESIAYLNNFDKEKILRPGDVIKVPPVSGIIVTVKAGDTIYSLAKKYGLPGAQSMVDWPYNSFANDETFALAAGQTLVVPGGKPPEEAPILPRTISAPTLFAGGTGQFSWPAGGIITQYFTSYHSGVDIANGCGTNVLAADTGRVISVSSMSYGYGNYVVIDHGNGWHTLYGHLIRSIVDEGDNVARGQQIGTMGSTGRSTGCHVHFEVQHSNGSRVNPMAFLH